LLRNKPSLANSSLAPLRQLRQLRQLRHHHDHHYHHYTCDIIIIISQPPIPQ
jgi:hypothetical protein